MTDLDRIAFTAVAETLVNCLKYVESAYRNADANQDSVHRAMLRGLIGGVSVQVEKLEKLTGIER